MANALIQFLLIDHLAATGFAVLVPCLWFKWYVVTHCVSHPCYRGAPPDQER